MDDEVIGHIGDEDGCIRRTLVLTMMSDGDLDPEELCTIVRVYREVTGRTIDEAVLRDEARALVDAGAAPGRCSGLGDGLDEAARLRVFAAAFAVAAADGFLVQQEDALLSGIAADLGLSHAAYRAEIRRLLAEHRRPT